MNSYKTIGILGGMGPLATYDLGMKILDNTRAECDQDHIPVLIDSNTRIADRTEAILHGGADPLPEMILSAKRLEAAGADFLIIPCNTAHYFYDGVSECVSIPVLHMPRETAGRLREAAVRRAGILATDGTCQSGIYDSILREEGIEPIYPSEECQRTIMSLIYDYVKAGNMDFSELDIDGAVDELKQKGAEALVLACTELPMAFDIIGDTGLPVIDPTEVLAQAAVVSAGGRLK